MEAHGAVVDEDLVRGLLQDQHPDLARLPIRLGARGWDNQLWRLGDDLAVRLPWATEAADALLLKEFTWLPRLAPLLPLPVPVPLRLGVASARYPRPWLVTSWLPGTPGDLAPLRGRPAPTALAGFLAALHRAAPENAPPARDRGGALAEVAEGLLQALSSAAERELLPDPGAVETIWQHALDARPYGGPPVWLHGDLHPANVLTEGGGLAGVIDFGDLCAGDPALDIAAAWILLPDLAGVSAFREAYGPDDAMWRRARGWAVWRALGSLHIADAGRRGLPGGKTTWGPPALRSLAVLTASAS